MYMKRLANLPLKEELIHSTLISFYFYIQIQVRTKIHTIRGIENISLLLLLASCSYLCSE